jgi:hypothetical protein
MSRLRLRGAVPPVSHASSWYSFQLRTRKALPYLFSSVGIGTRLQAEGPGFDSRQGQEIFFFYIESGSALGPTEPPLQ